MINLEQIIEIHKIKWRGLSLILIIIGLILNVVANSNIKVFLLNNTILYVFGFIWIFLGLAMWMYYDIYYDNKKEIIKKKLNKCYSCGGNKELIKVENAIAKTLGCDVSIKECYACKSCLDRKRIYQIRTKEK